MPKKSNSPLFHSILKQMKTRKLKDLHILLAVSGGLDSMSLAVLFLELKKSLNLQISIAHIHHNSTNKKQKKFQDQALNTVQTFCKKNQIKIYTKKLYARQNRALDRKQTKQPKQQNKNNRSPSEEMMRKQRQKFFSECLKKIQADYLALAHTSNDLLETRILRLIRGTGKQGLTAMQFKKNQTLRPFIHTSRKQILQYACSQKTTWQEDPSNQSLNYSFRNWIRLRWLAELEKKQAGALKALSRSLELILQNHEKKPDKIKYLYNLIVFNNTLNRKGLKALSDPDKRKVLALYMHKQHFKNYSLSHLQELIKQLDRPRKNFTFSLLGKTWLLDPLWIRVQTQRRGSKKV